MDDPRDKARIAANVQKMLAQGAKQDDIESYLQSEGLSPVSQQAHRPLNPTQIRRLGKSQSEKNAADQSELPWQAALPEAPVKKFLGAAALPLQGLPGGEAAEAAIGASRLGGNTDYRTALRTQRETTGRLGEGTQMALKAVGAAAGMAIPGAGALLSNPLGQAAIGAAYGASDADPDQSETERALRGGIGAVAAPAMGWIGGKVLQSNAAAKLMGTAASAIRDEPFLAKTVAALTPQPTSQSFQRIATPRVTQALTDALSSLEQYGNLSNASRDALKRLAAAQQRGERAGLSGAPEFPNQKGMPETLGVDVANPAVLEESRGAAQTVPGREALIPALESRERQAIPAITEGIPDAMAARRAMAQARKDAARRGMEAAIEKYTGQAIDLTPELESVANTPAGKAGLKSAVRSRLNVPERELPDVPIMSQVEGYEPTEFVPPGEQQTKKGLDAEALHLWTRALRRMAQGEAGQQKPAGKAASDAIASGDLRNIVVNALPPEFKAQMDAYREASAEINALDLGRTPHPLNPQGLNRSDKSLTDVEAAVAAMTPKNRSAYETGKQFDLASRLHGGQSVESMADQLAVPGSQTQREAVLSNSPIAHRVMEWNRALQARPNTVGSGRGPAQVRSGEGAVSGVAGPTKERLLVNTLHKIAGKLSDVARERQGLQDAAFNKLLAQSATQYQKALEYAKTPGERERIIRAAIAFLTSQQQNGTDLPYTVRSVLVP